MRITQKSLLLNWFIITDRAYLYFEHHQCGCWKGDRSAIVGERGEKDGRNKRGAKSMLEREEWGRRRKRNEKRVWERSAEVRKKQWEWEKGRLQWKCNKNSGEKVAKIRGTAIEVREKQEE